MRGVRSLPLAQVAIASILAPGLWARQTRSWRRPESCRAPRCRSFAAAFSAGSSARLISIATPHVACASHKPLKIRPERMYIACAPSTSFQVIAVARNRIDHGDLLDRKIGNDLDLLFVHDEHLLDAHAVAESLAVLGLKRKRHAGLDLDRVIERPDARDHRRAILRKP